VLLQLILSWFALMYLNLQYAFKQAHVQTCLKERYFSPSPTFYLVVSFNNIQGTFVYVFFFLRLAV